MRDVALSRDCSDVRLPERRLANRDNLRLFRQQMQRAQWNGRANKIEFWQLHFHLAREGGDARQQLVGNGCLDFHVHHSPDEASKLANNWSCGQAPRPPAPRPQNLGKTLVPPGAWILS